MSDSQRETAATNKLEVNQQRAFRLLLILGAAGILSGIAYSFLDKSGVGTQSPVTAFVAGIIQFFGAYLIYKKRMFWGISVAAAVGFGVTFLSIAQTSGTGLIVIASVLLIFMMIFPMVLTEKDGLNRVQIGAVVLAAALIIVDLYWPYPRQPAEPEFIQFTSAFLFILVIIFAVALARRFPTFTLRSKLISTTLVVTALAIVAVAFGVNTFTRNALTTETGKELQALSQSQGLLIGELLAREVTSLQALTLDDSFLAALEAQNESYTGSNDEILAEILAKDSSWQDASPTHPAVTAILRNPIADKMRQFSTIFPGNSNLLLTDRYGALIAATQSTERYYLAEEAWWENAYGVGFGKTYLSEPGLNERSGIGYLQIALPIFTKQPGGPSHLSGILYSQYSLKSLEDLMTASQAGETQAITVHLPGFQLALDENNHLQVYDDGLVSEAMLSEVQLSDAGYTFVNFDDVPHLFSVGSVNTLNHQPIIDDLNWRVSVQQAEDEALASVAQQQRLNILLGTFVILGAAAAAAFIGAKLTGPILRLTTVAEEVSAGNLNVQADVTTQDEIGTLAAVFNSMTAQVRESIHTLEQRVADRTRALEISGGVSRQLSNILDQQELVQVVVKQVKDAFDYYHAHIYLFDDSAKNLIMVGGTGEAGKQLLANQHRIPAGKGLVGRSGKTGQPVLVPDTAQSEDWLPNPLLPDTKAEIAVPIISGDKVLGVLDVQQDEIGGLSQTDVDLLESIANQVAVGLRNARLFEEAQQQAKREALMNEINQKISDTKDVQEAMQVAVREIGRALNASQTVVRFTQDDSGRRFGDTKPLNGANGQQK